MEPLPASPGSLPKHRKYKVFAQNVAAHLFGGLDSQKCSLTDDTGHYQSVLSIKLERKWLRNRQKMVPNGRAPRFSIGNMKNACLTSWLHFEF